MHRLIRTILAAAATVVVLPFAAAGSASAATGPCPVVEPSAVALTNVKLCTSGLTATKRVVDDNVSPAQGSQITFELTVTNSGQVPELGVRALDKLPPELTFISAKSNVPTAHYFPASGLWLIGNLLPANGVHPADKAVLDITVLVNGPDLQTNCVTATGAPEFGRGEELKVAVADTSNTACAHERPPAPSTPAPTPTGSTPTPTSTTTTTSTTGTAVTPGFPATGVDPEA